MLADDLGLTRDQFTQVVLLPQGEFARFLRANDDERRALLTKLFGTQLYDRITDELDRRRTQVSGDLDDAAERLRAPRVRRRRGRRARRRPSRTSWPRLPPADARRPPRRARRRAGRAGIGRSGGCRAGDRRARARAQTARSGPPMRGRPHASLRAGRHRRRAEHEATRASYEQARRVLAAADRAEPVRPLLAALDDAAAAVGRGRSRRVPSVEAARRRSTGPRRRPRASTEAAELQSPGRDRAATARPASAPWPTRAATLRAYAASSPSSSPCGPPRCRASSRPPARPRRGDGAGRNRSSRQPSRARPRSSTQAHGARCAGGDRAASMPRRARTANARSTATSRAADEHLRLAEARVCRTWPASSPPDSHDGDACPVCGSVEHPRLAMSGRRRGRRSRRSAAALDRRRRAAERDRERGRRRPRRARAAPRERSPSAPATRDADDAQRDLDAARAEVAAAEPRQPTLPGARDRPELNSRSRASSLPTSASRRSERAALATAAARVGPVRARRATVELLEAGRGEHESVAAHRAALLAEARGRDEVRDRGRASFETAAGRLRRGAAASACRGRLRTASPTLDDARAAVLPPQPPRRAARGRAASGRRSHARSRRRRRCRVRRAVRRRPRAGMAAAERPTPSDAGREAESGAPGVRGRRRPRAVGCATAFARRARVGPRSGRRPRARSPSRPDRSSTSRSWRAGSPGSAGSTSPPTCCGSGSSRSSRRRTCGWPGCRAVATNWSGSTRARRAPNASGLTLQVLDRHTGEQRNRAVAVRRRDVLHLARARARARRRRACRGRRSRPRHAVHRRRVRQPRRRHPRPGDGGDRRAARPRPQRRHRQPRARAEEPHRRAHRGAPPARRLVDAAGGRVTPRAAVLLAPNLPETFYAGLRAAGRFHGEALPDRPEEWVASTTRRFGQPTSGLSSLARRQRPCSTRSPPTRSGWLGRSPMPTPVCS